MEDPLPLIKQNGVAAGINSYNINLQNGFLPVMGHSDMGFQRQYPSSLEAK